MSADADPMDAASRLEEAEREHAIAEARAQIPEGDWREISAKWCETPTCGLRIPDLRRRTIPGVQLCVECAEREERMAHRRGRR